MENDMKELSGVKLHCAFEKAVDVVDLVEHPRNPNKHGDKQIALLAKIIACEQLDKKCRAIEIDPNYVAVALERYVDATGKEPVLLNARD